MLDAYSKGQLGLTGSGGAGRLLINFMATCDFQSCKELGEGYIPRPERLAALHFCPSFPLDCAAQFRPNHSVQCIGKGPETKSGGARGQHDLPMHFRMLPFLCVTNSPKVSTSWSQP